MTKKNPNTKMIAFTLPIEIESKFADFAKTQGFPSASLWVRALVLQMVNTPEGEAAMIHAGEVRTRVQKNLMRNLMGVIQTMTIEELLRGDD